MKNIDFFFFGYKIILELSALICVLLVNSQHVRRLDSFMDTKYAFDDGPEKPPTSFLFGYNIMASKLYQLSPPEVNIFDDFIDEDSLNFVF